jgi:outer membrane protein assembly factor BamB
MPSAIRDKTPVRTKRILPLLLVSAFILSGCDLFSSAFSSKKEKLPGQRISVLELEKQLEPDPGLASLEVTLPRPSVNQDWPQSGGLPTHDMGHPALSDTLSVAWKQNVGEGASRYAAVLAGPVVVNGVIYAMDSKSLISARNAQDGTKIWETDITPPDDDNQAWGGGIAYDEGKIFVTSGYGLVLRLDAKTGKEDWLVPTGSPVRGAPTLSDGRVFLITVDNELQVLSSEDGHRLWTYDGIPESAELAGSASPAVTREVVVAPFSSGEIVALRVENGRVIWNDSLAATRRFDPMSTLADVRGRPVIDRGRVYAISHSGRMTAIDLRTGNRIWEQDVGGSFAPWVAGDFIYVLSTSDELICLTRDDGRIRWITQLNRYEDLEDKSGPIQWAGPILAGDRLIVLGSIGEAWSVSPYTGQILSRFELPAASFLPPVVANKTLYLMTDDADLMALR